MLQNYLIFSLKGNLKMMIVKLEVITIFNKKSNTSKVLVFKIGYSDLSSTFSYCI